MTEKEHRVRQCELNVREQETRVRDAKVALDFEYEKLKTAYDREVIKLEKEKACLDVARAELARGFDT